jgi:hypothetical protein
MLPCGDESAFKWIEQNRSTPLGKYDDPDWKGVPVSAVLPSTFDRYVKILHRLDARYDNIDHPLSPDEIAIVGIPECSRLRNLVESHRGSESTRIRWKSVADALGLAFESGITDDWFRAVIEAGCWPRLIYGPDDGWLNGEEASALLQVLGRATVAEAIYLRMAEIPLIVTEIPLLYEGCFEDVVTLLRSEQTSMQPEYWWPPDRAWCVCSDYDLTFTMVGASDEVCQELLEDKALECIEVKPETRVDFRSPPRLL